MKQTMHHCVYDSYGKSEWDLGSNSSENNLELNENTKEANLMSVEVCLGSVPHDPN